MIQSRYSILTERYNKKQSLTRTENNSRKFFCILVSCPLYLLLTEFEGCVVSYGLSFFPCDLWPKRAGHTGLSLSFEAAVACKLSPVAVKYVANDHVPKARKGLSILGGLGACPPEML